MPGVKLPSARRGRSLAQKHDASIFKCTSHRLHIGLSATARAKRGEIQAQLFGDLEAVLAWAHDREDKKREAVGGFPWEVEGALSISVSARTCSEDSYFSRADRAGRAVTMTVLFRQ